MDVKYYSKERVTDGMKSAVETALAGLDKYLDSWDASVAFKTVNDTHKVEVNVHSGGRMFRVSESSDDMYRAINKMGDVLDRKVRKFKDKKSDAKKRAARLVIDTESVDADDSSSYEIVKHKVFEAKLMDVHAAIEEMEMLGHDFFLFVNSESGRSATVYKRDDGKYGLIETA